MCFGIFCIHACVLFLIAIADVAEIEAVFVIVSIAVVFADVAFGDDEIVVVIAVGTFSFWRIVADVGISGGANVHPIPLGASADATISVVDDVIFAVATKIGARGQETEQRDEEGEESDIFHGEILESLKEISHGQGRIEIEVYAFATSIFVKDIAPERGGIDDER